MKLAVLKVWDLRFEDADLYAEDTKDGITLHCAGWLVRETERVVVIGLDHTPETNQFRFILSIPRSAILEYKVYELAECSLQLGEAEVQQSESGEVF